MNFNIAFLIGLTGLTCIGLVGCSKEIKLSESEVFSLKKPLAEEALDEYFDRYEKKGTPEKVYITDNNHSEKIGFDPYQNRGGLFGWVPYLDDCLKDIPINSNDLNVKYNLVRGTSYSLKEDYSFDKSNFNLCIRRQLYKTELNYDNLNAFSNDKTIQEFKANNEAISTMIESAKSDGKISIGEALDIYLAVSKAKEKLLFNKI